MINCSYVLSALRRIGWGGPPEYNMVSPPVLSIFVHPWHSSCQVVVTWDPMTREMSLTCSFKQKISTDPNGLVDSPLVISLHIHIH